MIPHPPGKINRFFYFLSDFPTNIIIGRPRALCRGKTKWSEPGFRPRKEKDFRCGSACRNEKLPENREKFHVELYFLLFFDADEETAEKTKTKKQRKIRNFVMIFVFYHLRRLYRTDTRQTKRRRRRCRNGRLVAAEVVPASPSAPFVKKTAVFFHGSL